MLVILSLILPISALAGPPAELGGRTYKLTAPTPGPDDEFGYAVAGAGDFDGDGFDEIIIGGHMVDLAAANAGAVFLFPGSERGIEETDVVTLLASDAVGGETFGAAVSGPGDLDGDGLDDFAVGAPGHDGSAANAGAVYLYFGHESGLPSATESLVLLDGAAASSGAGFSLGAPGDVDGDGLPDLLVGAPDHDGVGAVWLLSDAGATQLMLQAPDPSDGDDYGYAVHGGDLDGDGYAEVVVGARQDDGSAPNAGAVYSHAGSSTGPASGATVLLASDAADSDQFGRSLAVVGDLDGDGIDDLVIGAHQVDDVASNEGAIYVVLGDAGGPSMTDVVRIGAPDPLSAALFGVSIAPVGDLDGDGHADVLVGASGASADGISSGAAYVFGGSDTGLSDSPRQKLAPTDAESGNRFGWAVTGAGDVNADTVPDLAIGAYKYGPDSANSGAVFAFVNACYDIDSDGWCSTQDCDDEDPDTFPGAAGRDSEDDCMRDTDEDGYGDSDVSGVTVAGSDCDDTDGAVFPGAEELCNDIDDDCDASIDNDAVDAPWWGLDDDGDGWSSADEPQQSCDVPDGYISPTFLADCDDADADVHPGAVEVAEDGIDQDCSGADLALIEQPKDKKCSAVDGVAGWLWLPALLLGLRRRR